MSPEAEEEAFRRLLEDEARKERTLVQALVRGHLAAAQTLSLARVQYDRALRELPGAIESNDYDEPYLSVYRSLTSGAKALLAAYGYRVRGGEGAHVETLRLSAMALVVWDRDAGTEMERIREPMRSARNEAEYQRPGVTTSRELHQLFQAASKILPAMVKQVGRVLGAPQQRGLETWQVPDIRTATRTAAYIGKMSATHRQPARCRQPIGRAPLGTRPPRGSCGSVVQPWTKRSWRPAGRRRRLARSCRAVRTISFTRFSYSATLVASAALQISRAAVSNWYQTSPRRSMNSGYRELITTVRTPSSSTVMLRTLGSSGRTAMIPKPRLRASGGTSADEGDGMDVLGS